MNKQGFFSRLCIVLFTCMIMLPCYAKDVNGSDWKFYFRGADGTSFHYDANSINVLPANVIRVWIKGISETEEDRLRYILNQKRQFPDFPNNWFFSIALYEINCKNKTFTGIEVLDYDMNNEFISAETVKNPTPVNISPDSMTDVLQKLVCSKMSSKKKGR